MLPPPARYFPLEKGVYEVAPGLRSLNQDLGNGARDSQVFQLDSDFPRFRESKEACRRERLDKYHLTARYSHEASTEVNRFLVTQLVKEHPRHFAWLPDPTGGGQLQCRLTGEDLILGPDYELRSKAANIGYVSAFDALCSQVQEDVAVMSRSEDATEDWLAAIHLCSPSHWAAADKIGRNFFDIHMPVAGIEKINRAAPQYVDAMIHKGPYVRFVWGFGTDRQLNHHPEPPPGVPLEDWRGRTFNRSAPGSPFILRVERQVLWGLPQARSAVFTIRVYFVDGEEIRRDPARRALLRSGLLSMAPESRVYKGLADCMDDIIGWLDKAN